jgi:hypothetical protein
MLDAKSNTLFVGYLDQIHLHAGVSGTALVELAYKEFIRVERSARRALADTDHRTSPCGANTELAEQLFPGRRGQGPRNSPERRKNKRKTCDARSQKANTKAGGGAFFRTC